MMKLGEVVTRNGVQYVVASVYVTPPHVQRMYVAYQIPEGESAETMGRTWDQQDQPQVVIYESDSLEPTVS